MSNALDHSESVSIEISRVQRETMERWCRICLNAGEIEEAERLRAEIDHEPTELERAAA